MIMSQLNKIRLGYRKALKNYFVMGTDNRNLNHASFGNLKREKVPVKSACDMDYEQIYRKDKYDFY